MPLRPCRECGKEVSTEAKACPHCGVKAPVPRASKKGLVWWSLGATLILLWLFNQNSDAPARGTAHTPTPEQLAANRAAAAHEQSNRDSIQRTRAESLVAVYPISQIPKMAETDLWLGYRAVDSLKHPAWRAAVWKQIEQREAAGKVLARQVYAQNLDRTLLEKGTEATVTTRGRGHDILHISYILAGRSWSHNFFTAMEQDAAFMALGFRKVQIESSTDIYTLTLKQ